MYPCHCNFAYIYIWSSLTDSHFRFPMHKYNNKENAIYKTQTSQIQLVIS